MSPVGISVLMLLAFAGFVRAGLAQAPDRARAASPSRAGTGRGSALRSVVVNGLLQRRMVRREWRPGVMHAVIFLGFVSLLLRKLQLIAIGYRESAAFPDAFGGPFAAFKDAIEIAVVVAVLYAFYRRFVAPAGAARAQPRGDPGARADPRDHGHRLRVRRLPLRAAVRSVPAIAHERAYAFVGGALADALAGLWNRRPCRPATRCRTGRRWRWCCRSSCCCRSASTSTSSPRCRPCTSAAAGPATGCPRVDVDKLMEAEDEARDAAPACAARSTSPGRTGSTPSPAPSAAAARTPARRI